MFVFAHLWQVEWHDRDDTLVNQAIEIMEANGIMCPSQIPAVDKLGVASLAYPKEVNIGTKAFLGVSFACRLLITAMLIIVSGPRCGNLWPSVGSIGLLRPTWESIQAGFSKEVIAAAKASSPFLLYGLQRIQGSQNGNVTHTHRYPHRS